MIDAGFHTGPLFSPPVAAGYSGEGSMIHEGGIFFVPLAF